MRAIVSTAVGCLVASLAFAAFDASATTSATTLATPSGTAFAITRDATPIVVARRGGPEAGDARGGNRGKDAPPIVARRGEPEAGDDRGGNRRARAGRGKSKAGHQAADCGGDDGSHDMNSL